MASPDTEKALEKPGTPLENNDDEVSSWQWAKNMLVPISIVIGLLVIGGIFLHSGWSSFVNILFESIESADSQAMQALVINAVLFIMVVCCVPGPAFLIILDGFFFGLLKGFFLGFFTELLAYLTCIALARSCFRARMRQWVLESESLREVLMVCEEDTTGKFLVLFRFISMPVWVKNYTIGLLDISWSEAVVVFLPAECFYCGIFVYIGSKGHAIADAIRKGNTQKAVDSFSGAEVAMVGMTFLVLILIIVFGWYEYSKRKAALDKNSRSETEPLAGAAKDV